MIKLTTRLSALGLALLVFTTACNDNIVEPIYGSGCVQGTLTAGQAVTGSLSPSSCRQTYNFYTADVMPYESWNVHLDAGLAYMFYLQKAPDPAQEGLNSVDPVLVLYGKDDQGHSIPLAASDDDGDGADGLDSEFWFIAPKSGDFVLTAGSYDWEDFGGYRLTMSTCPVLGVLDTAGTYHFSSPTSPCVRHGSNLGAALTYTFLSVPADSFETITITIDHDESTAYYELGGPGLDTYSNVFAETDYNSGSNAAPVSISTSEIAGLLTIAVGTEDFDAPGTYTLALGRASFASPPAAPWRDGRFTLRAPAPKRAK